MKSTIRNIVKEELSGENAKLYVQQISSFHRIQASTMFHEAAEYIRDTLLKIGIKNAKIEQFKSDGSKKYWTYTSPIGWEVKEAELRLIEPKEKLLCRYADVPTCLHTHSKATRPEGVIAELVDVGIGSKAKDYNGKDVKGKFALATGIARIVHEQAVYKRGAAGVITDTLTREFKNVRESLDIPDACSYQAIWPTKEDLDKVTFGFSISKRQGGHLRNLLKNDESVKLKAKVDAKLFSSNLELVIATIPGSSKPDEEVFLIAHLCHPKPSANDNASGSGLLLEIARVLTILIDSGKISRPARTIRFIWTPETYGTIAFLHDHQEMQSKLVAGINLDMVGQDQELCKSTLTLDKTPDSLPSYLNDLVLNLIEESIEEFDPSITFGSASTFRYKENVFTGGSDHAEFTDSTIEVPCVMLLQWPDIFYHSSMDTIDKVSPKNLKRVGWVATVATLIVANADLDEAIYIANQTSSRGTTRIKEAGRKAIEELYRLKENPKIKQKPNELIQSLARKRLYYQNKIKHIMQREEEAVSSVKRLTRNTELDTFLQNFTEDISIIGEKEITRINKVLSYIATTIGIFIPDQIEETKAEKETRKITPQRRFKGSLSMETVRKSITDEEFEWYEKKLKKDPAFQMKIIEVLNFMDGKRTLYEIINSVSAEYTETKAEDVLKYLRYLEKIKLVSL
jgi:hypothetical protein